MTNGVRSTKGFSARVQNAFRQDRCREAQISQFDIRQDCPAKTCPFEPRPSEIRAIQVGIGENGVLQICIAQPHAAHGAIAKIDRKGLHIIWTRRADTAKPQTRSPAQPKDIVSGTQACRTHICFIKYCPLQLRANKGAAPQIRAIQSRATKITSRQIRAEESCPHEICANKGGSLKNRSGNVAILEISTVTPQILGNNVTANQPGTTAATINKVLVSLDRALERRRVKALAVAIDCAGLALHLLPNPVAAGKLET
ncbi:MAG: hypothetical protein WCO83_01565 [Alphaproteobacteria bacterium]